jgi:thiamine biosynthesis protein ThiI
VSGPPSLRAPDVVLVRYGELALKGGNRARFERTLVRNIKHAVRSLTPVVAERHTGRIVLLPESRAQAVARRLQDVFGIKSVSPAWTTPSEPDAITELARGVLEDALTRFSTERPVTFRVRASRAEKRFPMSSTELDRHVAERILPGPERVRVQLRDPELELGIDVRSERSYVFVDRLAGPGGLPVGTLGRALCLLSGGIDSPVAAWLAMKRGAQVGFVSYHSSPYLGEGSRRKVLDLAQALGRYQGRSAVHVVPFAPAQVAIRDAAPEPYRTVLYRRMMQRIASRLARERDYGALITGESMGQVASQTLENLECIEAASSVPVLRPLLTFDKEETIELARRIRTLEISNRPEPDCCTVFQPRRPVIHGRIEECERAEASLDVGSLVERAVAGTEVVVVDETGRESATVPAEDPE